MPPRRPSRDRWIEQGLRALAAGGPDAVRVEALARRLDVTKGSFYWHFADRDALLAALLDTWEQRLIDDVVEQIEARGGDARAKLRRLFAMAAGNRMLRVELAVRDWARRDRVVARRLRRVDNRRMEYLRSLFGAFCVDEDDLEARCLLVMALFVGNDFIAADHGPRTRADVLAAATRRLLAP